MSAPLRWAILGTSFISHTVAAAIQSSPASTLVSVFGRDATRLAAFADAGVEQVLFAVAAREPDERRRMLDTLVTDVVPSVQAL